MSSKPCTWADASHEFPGIETSWRIFCGTSGPDRPKPYVEFRLELEPRRLHVIQVGAPGKDAGPRWIGEATGLGMYKWEYRYLRPYRYSSRQEAVLRREFRKKALEQDKFAVQYARLQFVERNPFVDQLRPHIIRLIKSDYEISWFWKNEPCDRTGYVLKPRPKFYWNALKKEEEV